MYELHITVLCDLQALQFLACNEWSHANNKQKSLLFLKFAVLKGE